MSTSPRAEWTLRHAIIDFHRRPITWRRLAPLGMTAVARLAAGRPTRADLGAAVAAGAAFGPLEWLGHHHVFHGYRLGPLRPRPATPQTASHLAHHRRPDDLELLFDPLEGVQFSLVATAGAAIVMARWTKAPLTALVTGLALVAAHHWFHYLMHAPYRPRSRWLASIETNHLGHHDGPDTWRMGVVFMTTDRVVERMRARRDRSSETRELPRADASAS